MKCDYNQYLHITYITNIMHKLIIISNNLYNDIKKR